MQFNNAIDMFTALGQDTRLSAFRLLVEAGAAGLNAGDISRETAVNESTLSRHLDRLEKAGLVTRERESRHIRYAVNWAGMNSLLNFMVEDCCRNDPACCLGDKCCD